MTAHPRWTRGSRVLYHGAPATVLAAGTLAHATFDSPDRGRCYRLRSEVDRGGLRVGSEFRAAHAALTPDVQGRI